MALRRLTKQRRQILGIVKAACYHPTAEQIFTLAKRTISNISVGTVYRNLEVLSADGLLKRIDIPGEPARYDADPNHKAYFVCRDKGSIYDLDLDAESLSKLLKDHPAIDRIDDFSLVVFGSAKENPMERKLRKGQLKQ